MNARLISVSLLITSAVIAFGLFFLNGVSNIPPHSDGGSHYVTGLLAFDWIHLGYIANPITFGTEYFKHFPYIGLLLWPPFFYFLEMIAFSLFGPTTHVSLVLVTAILIVSGALLGYAVWKSGRSLLVAHATVAATMTSILVQDIQRNILIDGLVALLSFAAALAFSSYVLKPALAKALGVAVLAVLAFYSKGNALQLALILPLIAFFMNRPTILIDKKTLLLAAVCIITTGPYLYLTAALSGQGALYAPGISTFLSLLAASSVTLFWALCFLTPFSIIGAGAVLYRVCKEKGLSQAPKAFEATCLATVIGSVGFHSLLAVGDDARYMLTALFGMVGLAIVGIEVLTKIFAKLLGQEQAKFFSAASITTIMLAQTMAGLFTPVAPMPTGAYKVAEAIVNALPKGNRSVMISGDHNIETSIGPALAQTEGKKRFEKDGLVVVRGSRALVGGGYRNRDFSAKFKNDEEYENELRRLGIPVIVSGASASGDSWPHIAAIERILKSETSNYTMIAEIPFFQGQKASVWKLKPELVKPINFDDVSASNTLRERVNKVTADINEVRKDKPL